MKLSLAVLADYANVSQEGKLNVLGIFNVVFARSLPVSHPLCFLVVSLVAEPPEKGQEHRFEFALKDPDGQLRASGSVNVQLAQTTSPGPLIHNMLLPLPGLTFERYGPHEIELRVNDEELDRLRLEVLKPPGAA